MIFFEQWAKLGAYWIVSVRETYVGVIHILCKSFITKSNRKPQFTEYRKNQTEGSRFSVCLCVQRTKPVFKIFLQFLFWQHPFLSIAPLSSRNIYTEYIRIIYFSQPPLLPFIVHAFVMSTIVAWELLLSQLTCCVKEFNCSLPAE